MREAFLVFLSLTVMALFNAGLVWEQQRLALQFMNFELKRMLDLDEHQIEEIRSIQANYESEVSRIDVEGGQATATTVTNLIRERDRKILDVLSDQQKGILSTRCADVVSFSKMLE